MELEEGSSLYKRRPGRDALKSILVSKDKPKKREKKNRHVEFPADRKMLEKIRYFGRFEIQFRPPPRIDPSSMEFPFLEIIGNYDSNLSDELFSKTSETIVFNI